MKIRNGFVSNSSTSSFLIYGIYTDTYEMLEKFKATGFVPEDVEDLTEWLYEDGEDKIKEKGLSFKSSYESGCVAIGISYDEIKDDETGLQFKERIEKAIKEIAGEDIKCSACEDAWRNG